MTGNSLALFMADLGVNASHSGPRISNHNPFSEARSKTAKCHPSYPDFFDSLLSARVWATLLCLVQLRAPPDRPGADDGCSCPLRVGAAIAAAESERIVPGPPEPARTLRPWPARAAPRLPVAAWINPPIAVVPRSPALEATMAPAESRKLHQIAKTVVSKPLTHSVWRDDTQPGTRTRRSGWVSLGTTHEDLSRWPFRGGPGNHSPGPERPSLTPGTRALWDTQSIGGIAGPAPSTRDVSPIWVNAHHRLEEKWQNGSYVRLPNDIPLLPKFLMGITTSVGLTLITIGLGSAIGLIVSVCKLSKFRPLN